MWELSFQEVYIRDPHNPLYTHCVCILPWVFGLFYPFLPFYRFYRFIMILRVNDDFYRFYKFLIDFINFYRFYKFLSIKGLKTFIFFQKDEWGNSLAGFMFPG